MWHKVSGTSGGCLAIKQDKKHHIFCRWFILQSAVFILHNRICINLFSNYAWSACPSSEALPMCFSQSATVIKFFVCLHINTMLLEHFHDMALILMIKTFMPYLQCFRLRCQVDLCSMSWNTHPNHQYLEVINELTQCCNSSITSANNNFFFIQGCAIAVLGGCLDGE